ncbi:MAG: STAS domain-containing protein [Fuerstiella sp.]
MTTTSTFCIGSTDATIVARVTGHGTRDHCVAFVEEVTAAVQQADDHTLIVDVEQCEYLDSTFLGCLVTLYQKTETRMSVCASDQQKKKLFSSARIDRLIPIRQPADVMEPDQWHPICNSTDVETTVLVKRVAEAHRRLAEIEGPNAAVYGQVADQLESELRTRKPK